MLVTAVILLFISAATCSSTSRNYIPLSAPLPNGTMVLQCPSESSSFDLNCLGIHGCCSNTEIQGVAIESLCRNSVADDSGWVAQVQHDLNAQTALCHFDGHSADNVQLLLTPNASTFLDSLNRQDEELRQQQAIYLALQIIGGHIGLPILLLFSIFPKTAPRNLIFLNFCFTWIFSSVTFSIGLYRLGPASLTSTPLPFIHSDRECLAQATLVSGALVMADTAMCALIVQLWLDIRAAIHGPLTPGHIRWARATLLSAPYLSLLAFSLSVVSLRPLGDAPPGVLQTSFYCSLTRGNATLLLGQSVVLLAILIATLTFDVCIIRVLYRHWRFFRRTGGNGLQVSLSVVFRVTIFCVYRVVVTVYVLFPICWCFLRPESDHLHGYLLGYIRTCHRERAYLATILVAVLGDGLNEAWIDMLQGGTPLVAFLIFGTSKVSSTPFSIL
ncbi:hypothetical protein JB92DRAFT_2883907 [Gautieria morchelliformis]|nr:hypothetical protein JB92DRAFT_2883907 [Gautieria morchelliformis]